VGSRVAPLLRRLTNRISSPRPRVFDLAAPLAGHRMRLHWQTHKAYVFGTYEPAVTRAILEVVQPGWTVLDVGAHIGYFTLLLAERVGPQGKVIAFEALAQNFAVLQENMHLNGCSSTVLENRAVAAGPGKLTLRRNDDDPLTSTTSIQSGRAVAEVEAVGLDGYLGSRFGPISFVKVDAEGAEDAVLQGMYEVLLRDRPVLLIEIHGIDTYGERHPALCRLREMGYTLRYLDTPGTTVHVLAESRTMPPQGSNRN
jgi:FkbM family methyltransferase